MENYMIQNFSFV